MAMWTTGSKFCALGLGINSSVFAQIKDRVGYFSKLISKKRVWLTVPGMEQRSNVSPVTYLKRRVSSRFSFQQSIDNVHKSPVLFTYYILL